MKFQVWHQSAAVGALAASTMGLEAHAELEIAMASFVAMLRGRAQ
jgi:hypothetical protein